MNCNFVCLKTIHSFRYFLLNKPYGVLCQFSDPTGEKKTLKDLGAFPGDVYSVGRLDEDSEGLLVLTNDPSIHSLLINKSIKKEYWVQVEGIPTRENLSKFKSGFTLNIRGRTEKCLPAEATILEMPNPFPERMPPVRVRKNIPTA